MLRIAATLIVAALAFPMAVQAQSIESTQSVSTGSGGLVAAAERAVQDYDWSRPTRTRDSVADGALIGAGVGFGAGLIATIQVCGTLSTKDECGAVGWMALIAPGTAIGAGVGALVDLAISRRDVTTRAGAQPVRVVVAPQLTRSIRSVQARVDF